MDKFKSKVKEIFSKSTGWIKEHQSLVMLIAYGVLCLAVILLATLLMKKSAVIVCLLLVVQTLLAAFLYKLDTWIHGVLLVVQVCIAIIMNQFNLVLYYAVIYIVAILILQRLSLRKEKDGKR